MNDKELVCFIKNAAHAACEEAISNWYNNKYTNDEEEKRKNIDAWIKNKERIDILCMKFEANLLPNNISDKNTHK